MNQPLTFAALIVWAFCLTACSMHQFWQFKRACVDIRFDPKLSQLIVKFSGMTPAETGTYRLVPQFSGGGHELP